MNSNIPVVILCGGIGEYQETRLDPNPVFCVSLSTYSGEMDRF